MGSAGFDACLVFIMTFIAPASSRLSRGKAPRVRCKYILTSDDHLMWIKFLFVQALSGTCALLEFPSGRAGVRQFSTLMLQLVIRADESNRSSSSSRIGRDMR